MPTSKIVAFGMKRKNLDRTFGRPVPSSPIAPGSKIFAWEALEEYAYYHADILSLYETQGVSVRVQDSSKDSIYIRVIPAAKE